MRFLTDDPQNRNALHAASTMPEMIERTLFSVPLPKRITAKWRHSSFFTSSLTGSAKQTYTWHIRFTQADCFR